MAQIRRSVFDLGQGEIIADPAVAEAQRQQSLNLQAAAQAQRAAQFQQQIQAALAGQAESARQFDLNLRDRQTGRQFRAGEAQKGRDFTAGQNELARALQQALQRSSQEFSAGQADLQRTFQSGENKLGRDARTADAAAARAIQVALAEAGNARADARQQKEINFRLGKETRELTRKEKQERKARRAATLQSLLSSAVGQEVMKRQSGQKINLTQANELRQIARNQAALQRSLGQDADAEEIMEEFLAGQTEDVDTIARIQDTLRRGPVEAGFEAADELVGGGGVRRQIGGYFDRVNRGGDTGIGAVDAILKALRDFQAPSR